MSQKKQLFANNPADATLIIRNLFKDTKGLSVDETELFFQSLSTLNNFVQLKLADEKKLAEEKKLADNRKSNNTKE